MTINQRRKQLLSGIRSIDAISFDQLALEVFYYQSQHNPLYQSYIQLLKVDPASVRQLEDIPFLPISFFKNYQIQSGEWKEVKVFTSSGTTGQSSSRHLVRDPDWYTQQARNGFQHFYGPPSQYCFLALLPSYLERTGSSLIHMAHDFIELSAFPQSGFFLDELEELSRRLQDNRSKGIPTILLGVSFALLDFADQYAQNLEGVIIMETGGMKGRRKEITRQTLHQVLSSAFQCTDIHSEYGMTELFSQAYSSQKGLFYPSPTMKILSREVTDPLSLQKPGKTGVLNIIDLANLDTISFIATDDLGRTYEDGSFEVLGRLDNSDVRGCNLMVQ